MRRVILLASLTACQWFDTAESVWDHGEQVVDDPQDAPAILEDAVFDVLECQEVARPTTLQRVRDVIEDPTFEEVGALVTNPEDLASVVSLAGLRVEAAVLVAHNALFLFDEASLLHTAADGFSCGESVSLACTAGTKTTTVRCEDGFVHDVTVSFDRCTLDGKVIDGAVLAEPVEGNDGAARLTFAGLSWDDVDALWGGLIVNIDASERFEASMRADDGFKIVSHGGPSSELACGEELALDVVALRVDEYGTHVELVGEKRDDEQALSIATKGEHVTFTGSCSCPIAGSALQLAVPKPLGDPGDEATLAVSWYDDGDGCPSVDVRAVSWPAECYGLENAGADCGAGATVAVVQKLLGALCDVVE